jgi:hypothetical protein
MKSGRKQNSSLNYNSLTEEIIFENKGKKMAIAKNELLLIDTVFIKDRKFIVLNSRFVELLHHSKWDLYIEHKCRVEEPGKPAGYGGTSKTASSDSYSSYYSQGSVYELKLPDGYKTKPYILYWIKKTGELNRFANLRGLKKLYKDKKDIFKTYVKKYNVEYDNQESIIQLIEYLEIN